VDDIISAESITRNLATRFVGQRAFYYPSLTSTMDIARQEAQRGAAEGTAVVADEQTAGRGRLKRAWMSPMGSIAVSVILRPTIAQLPQLIMLASLAVAHSIESVTGLTAQIKWPNDVLINGRKVCGILIESDVRVNTVNYVVIGIGINVNLCVADFPEISPIATSLSEEAGSPVSRLSIVRRLLVELEKLYLSLSAGKSLREDWRDRLVTLGKRVRATTGDTVYEGVAESVDVDGSLQLRGADGSLTRIVVGDVTLRE